MTTRPLPLEVGTMLAGKYRIDDLLGRGGMGAVFAAENVDLGRAVAIKVLYGDLARDEHLVKRFRQEARAAAAIGHPGIVDVLDLGTTDDGAAFIVMERLDGETLGARLVRQGRLPAATAAEIVADALEALAAAHAKGIVHRDLKPDNVFLVARPVPAVKLVDFGISKLQGADDVGITTTGMVMGTPLYMSPEQARGAREVGQASDLYSMGAILYTALCGEPPLTGSSYNELIAKLVTEDPAPLLTKRRGLPPALYQLVDAMLAKDPGARPPARDTADRLRALSAQLGELADPAIAYRSTVPPDAVTLVPPRSVALDETTASAPPRPAMAMAPTLASSAVQAAAPPPARSRAPWIAVAVVAVTAIAVLAWLMTREPPPAATAVIDAGAVIAPVVIDAAPVVPVDAAIPPPDATARPPIDARPAGKKRKVDAGASTGTGTGLEIDTDNPLKPGS